MSVLVVASSTGDAYTTSIAVAEGVNMPHKSVIQLVRQHQDELEGFGTLAFQRRKSGGRPTESAILNERQATYLMTLMKNSPITLGFKHRLVSEFYRMAQQIRDKPRAPELSRMELLRMAMDSEQERIRLISEVEALEWQQEIDSHKVAFSEAVQARAGDMEVRKAAQVLSNSHCIRIGQKQLFSYLRDIGWLDKRSGVYQRAINQGVLSQRYKTRAHPRTGETIHYTQVLITTKGLARLHERLSREQEGAV